MRNHLFLCLLSLWLGGSLTAQDAGKVTIQGTLMNPEQQPLDFANVLLLNPTDSSLVKGAITDADGLYVFEMVPDGQYLISATMVGFQAAYYGPVTVNVAQTNLLTVPPMQLSTGVELQQVTVKAQKPFIEMQNDRIVVNVESSPVAAGNSALELLAKSPGVTVDNNNRIALKGKQGVLVMLDGKQSYLSAEEVARLLESMPATSIEKIEIIHNPSAKYDAAGNAGIINIKLKKDKNLGMNGSVTLGSGYGRYPKANSGLQLNYRRKQFNAFGSYNYYYAQRFQDMWLDRIIPFEGTQSVFNQTNDRVSWNNSHNMKAGLDWFAGKKTTVGVLFSGSTGYWRDDSAIRTLISGANPEPFSEVRAQTDTREDWDNFTYNFNVRHTLNDKGGELSFDADYSSFVNPSFQNSDNLFFNSKLEQVATPNLLRGNTRSDVTISAIKLDYTQPLPGDISFEAGLKSSFVTTDNNIRFLRNSADEFVVDPLLTNQFLYEETIHAGYINAGKKFKGFSVQAGLRGEYTISDGLSVTLDQRVQRDYLSLFPSLSISHSIQEKHNLSYSYSRRIDRPSYRDLNPFTYFLDQYTFGRGNPFLQPQFTDAFAVNYGFTQKFMVTLSYSRTNDAMTEVLEQNDEDRTTFQTRANLAQFENYSINLSAPLKIADWWSVRVNLSTFYNHFQSPYLGGEIDNRQFSYNTYISNNFTLPKGFRGELSGFYNSAGVYGMFEAQPQYAIDAGLFKSLWNGKGNLKLSMSDIFFTNRWQVAVRQDNINANVRGQFESRRVSLTYTQKFGNNEIKPARQRRTATEEEQGRAKGN
ncbi:MAG TPA: TonB-dependent receptor [Saprospiraceae bacterium]|nr:TonB-dependent receptor [Saprospiraceae bacterium]HMP24844.1 TonB-dependent receptor [Saprospiraceae bacterium]